MKKITLLLAVLISSYGFAQHDISFETAEGYTLGDINGQNGWTSTSDENGVFIENQIVTDEMATDGTNSFKVQTEAAFGPQQSAIIGGFYTFPQPINHTNATFSADIYMSDFPDGNDYQIGIANLTAQVFVLRFRFSYDGTILVADGGAWVDTGATWDPETWYEVKMVTYGNVVTYYIDDVQIYMGNLMEMEDFTQLRFVHDNYGGYAYMDNIQTMDGPLSVVGQTLDQISVYPNPAIDVINVNVPANVQINGAALYDVLGKNTGVTISNGQINIAHLSRGVYMLSLETSAGSMVKKIIKQ